MVKAWWEKIFGRKPPAPAAPRLRVGRRYLVKDFSKDSYFLCFMGKTVEGAYTFYNETDESYRELTFEGLKKPVTEAGLFEQGLVKELPEGY